MAAYWKVSMAAANGGGWPKAPVDGPRLNDRSRIADAQAFPMDIA
jgi:hypothetical protein